MRFHIFLQRFYQMILIVEDLKKKFPPFFIFVCFAFFQYINAW